MSRLFVLFVGADDVKEKLTNRIGDIYGAIKIDSIQKLLMIMHK